MRPILFISILLSCILLHSKIDAFQTASSSKIVLPKPLQDLKLEAELYINEGQWDLSIERFKQLQKEYKSLNLTTKFIDTYEDIFTVNVLRDDLDFEEKISFIEQIAQQEPSNRFKGIYWGALAHLHLFYEEIDAMEKYYTLAIELYKKEKCHRLQTNLNITIATEFYLFEDLKSAKHYIQKAELLEKEHFGLHYKGFPNLYNMQTAIYTDIGKYDQALASNLKSIALLEQDSHAFYLDLAYEYNNLATTHSALQDFDNSLDYYLKALALIEEVEGYSSIEAASITYNIGATHLKRSQHSQAKNAFLKSLGTLEKADNLDKQMMFDYINNCHHLVDCYDFYGQIDSALYFANRAEELNKKFPYRVSTTYSSFSNIYLKKGQLDLAETYGLKALEIGIEAYGSKNEFVFVALENLAKIALAQHKTTAALILCQRALESISIDFSDELGYSNPSLNNTLYKGKLLNILHLKMQLLEKLYLMDDQSVRSEDLFGSAKLATEALEQINKAMKSKESKFYWLNKKAIPLFEQAIEIALEIHTKTKDPQYLNEAFMLAEHSKSMLMMDALQESNASSYGGIPDSLVLREKELQKLLSECEKSRFDAKMAEDETALACQDSLIFHYKHDADVLAHTFENAYPNYYKLKYENKVADIQSIQQHLDKQSTLIEYFEGKDKIYSFVISASDAYVNIREQDADYINQIIEFQNTLVNIKAANEKPALAYNNFVTQSHQLYNLLLKDCLTASSNRLIIIPDGHLGYLPFEVLLEKPAETISQTGKNVDFSALPYLIHNYTINYNYSATLMLSQRKSKQQTPNGNVLAFAPSYSNIESPSWRGQHETKLRSQLTTLPGAFHEVKALSWLYKGNFLNGQAANETAFKTSASEYGILHLALHGLVDNKKPELSGLALEEDQSKVEDNILYAYEIKQLELQASLVVLSACETGIGKYQRGEGVMSIGRGFMYAGVPSLLMTLWNLNDYSSSVIIEQFYYNLSQGLEKDEAIRQAKLFYLKQYKGLPAHPALWACFVQVGDFKAIAINRQYWTIYYVLGAILLLIFLIWGYKRYKNHEKNVS